jgi:ABC-type polysaccharide/polyol phosphate export permease
MIIGTVYSIIFGTDPREFIPLLFTGLNPWIFISGSADSGTYSLLSAEGYIKQTTVNAQIFPLRTSLVLFVNLLYSVFAFFSVYLFLRPDCFSPVMLMSVPGLILLFLFALALANISSIINLHARDFQPMQSLILQGLFYATPIIFPVELLKEKGFAIIYQINPFYYLIEIVRRPMLGIQLPPPSVYIIAILITSLVLLFSIEIFMRDKKNIVFKF